MRYALELHPSSHKAWNDLGVVMETLGQPEEAAACYQRSMELEPSSLESRSNLFALWFQVSLGQAMGGHPFKSSMAC
ncbi:MAG: tetratricopeptide repeat protein [Acidobacteria bacterium]|nr:tetratricopeptide repeat protein [Acidobacteriota bacterium]